MSTINQEYYDKSRDSGVYFYHVKNAPDKPWDYEYLFQKNIYPGLGKEKALVNRWLEFFPRDRLNFSALSQHHYISQEWFDQFPEAPWVLEKLRRNKNFNFKMLLESKAVNHHEYDWSTQTFAPKEVTLNSFTKVLQCNWHPQNYRNYPMGDSWLAHIPETEDIYSEISENGYLNTSWLQAKPEAPWDIKKLAKHNSWCFEWLLIVKSDLWPLDELSSKPNMTFEVLQAYPQGNWDFRILSMRNEFTIEWVDEIPDAPWDFKAISKNMKLELSWVKKYPDQDWDFSQIGLFISLDFEWAKSFPDAPWNFLEMTPNIKDYAKWIEKYPNESWDYSLILKQPDMTLDLLKIIPEEKLDFDILSANYKLNLEWLKAFPDKPWHFHLFSVHKNLTLKWIDTFPESNWCFHVESQDSLGFHSSKTKKLGIRPGYNGRLNSGELIETGLTSLHVFYGNKFRKEWFHKYPDLDWDYSLITTYIAHDLTFLERYPNKPWDFIKLSRSHVVTTEMLRTYPEAPWDFYELAKNYNFVLDWIEILGIGKWDFEILSQHQKFNDNWILKYPRQNWIVDIDKISSFNTLAVYQFYHPEFENNFIYQVKDKETFDEPIFEDYTDSAMQLVLMSEVNKNYFQENSKKFTQYFNKDDLGFWLEQELTQLEKENVLKLIEDKYNFREFYPEVIYNMDEPLELQDLSGDIFLVENWFQSKNILELIDQTHPHLKGADFMIPLEDDAEDFSMNGKHNDDIKYYLLQTQSGPFAMVVYPEVED